MKITRPNDDLLCQLRRQIIFLTRSVQSFDAGNRDEAIQMAVKIRVLLHDSSNSQSLLSQLNKKNVMFYNTAHDYDPNNLLPQTLLVGEELGAQTCYWPRLDGGRPSLHLQKKPFSEWWSQIVICDKNKNKFTRKDLVMTLADQDGGAHVDPKLNDDYMQLSRDNSGGWTVSTRGIGRPMERPDFPSLRQIAHEVIKTLKEEFPEFFVT